MVSMAKQVKTGIFRSIDLERKRWYSRTTHAQIEVLVGERAGQVNEHTGKRFNEEAHNLCEHICWPEDAAS